jgi:hypothetical protein
VADLVEEDDGGAAARGVAGQLAQPLAHQPRLQPHLRGGAGRGGGGALERLARLGRGSKVASLLPAAWLPVTSA